MSITILDGEKIKDSLFFERELINILPTVYEAKRPMPSAREILPLEVSRDPDAMVTIAERLDWVGAAVAGEVGWKNGADTPVVSANRNEALYPVRSYKLGVQWRALDLRNARKLGLDLDSRGVQTVFNRLRLAESNLVWNGDAAQTGIFGITSNPDLAADVNLPSAATWDSTATADEILADLLYMANYIGEQTSYTQTGAITLLLPWTAFNIAAAKRLGSDADKTVMQFFRENTPTVVDAVIPVRELNSSKVAIAMVRDTTLATNFLVSDVHSFDPIRYSGGYSVDYELRTSGFVVYDSTSIQAFDQILT